MSEDAMPGPGHATAGAGLIDRLHGWADRLLMSPRFQRWAVAFPLTRPIARRRATALFDICAGFVYSQVLAACVRLRLLELLAEGPRDTTAIAERLGLEPNAAERLLRAAAALRLVARRGGGRWGLGAYGAPMLANPGIAAMVEHHATLYADLADPVALLRERRTDTALGRYWPYGEGEGAAGLEPQQVAAYTALMAASQPMVAAEILDAYPVARHRRLLDVGGGDGSFLCAAAARAPDLRLALFDLPAVTERARARFESAGLSHRAEVFGGSFHSDPLPGGADLVSLVRVLHDHDDADAVRLLRAVRAALPPEGMLLVAEPMAATGGAEAMGDAYFGFYLLAMGKGRPRTAEETAALLRAAGFHDIRPRATRMPMLVSVLTAQPDTPR